jgi:exosortase
MMIYCPSERQARNLWFLLFVALSIVLFRLSLNRLTSLSFHDERYSHLVLIPLISVCLVYFGRKRIFLGPQYSPRIGVPLLLLGMVTYCIAEVLPFALSQYDRLSLEVLALVAVWIGGFVLCYGTRSFRAAIFPLSFLLLTIPMPPSVLDEAVLSLQKGTAEITYGLFKILGVPVFWQGFNFSLPGVEIEIAKECSGIRSTLALFITGMLASHVFLQSGWRRVVLCLSTIPIAIFKNAVRIVTISSLGTYVDRDFLYGRLHHQGGLLFALIALGLFVPLLLILQNSEARSRRRQPGSDPGGVVRPNLGVLAR